jgi:NAD(P)-dependent dehydrogenase (short-subunit alcohol dehydrogenase family)
VVIAARGAERGHRVARQIEAAGGRALFVRADVSRAADVDGPVKTRVDCWSRLDCAFNNAAAVEEPFVPTAAFTEAQFVWLCLQQEIRQMLAQEPRGGAIVNTSSVNGLGGVPQAALYAAAKRV